MKLPGGHVLRTSFGEDLSLITEHAADHLTFGLFALFRHLKGISAALKTKLFL